MSPWTWTNLGFVVWGMFLAIGSLFREDDFAQHSFNVGATFALCGTVGLLIEAAA
jgi:hypothetical protein